MILRPEHHRNEAYSKYYVEDSEGGWDVHRARPGSMYGERWRMNIQSAESGTQGFTSASHSANRDCPCVPKEGTCRLHASSCKVVQREWTYSNVKVDWFLSFMIAPQEV